MTIRRANPRKQGLIGLGAAIAWFCEQGYGVSIPLNDSQAYDLVVEDGTGRLLKVQVKTTTARNHAGTFVVSLRTNGGNQSFHTTKAFDPRASDLLFVLTDEGAIYVLPSRIIKARTGISLGAGYERYRR